MSFRKKTLILFVLCFLYSTFLMIIFNSDMLRDRSSYNGYYALDSNVMLLDAYGKSFIKFLTEEPFFLLINIFFTKVLCIDNYLLPYLYSFLICFVFSFLVLKNAYNVLFIIVGFFMLFCVSISLHAQLVVLRQSLATCILLYFVSKNKSLYSLFFISIICALIHNSFFILTLYFIVSKLINDQQYQYRNISISIIIAFFFSIFFYLLGEYFSVRQVEHLENDISVNGVGFILWLSCLICILIKNIKFKVNTVNDMISVFGLIFYLVNYFILPIGGRLLLTFIPFIFISLISWSRRENKSLLFLLFLYDFIFILANAYKLDSNLIANSFTDGYTLFKILGL